MVRLKVKFLTPGTYCEMETPHGRLYYRTYTDDNDQTYYICGCRNKGVWGIPSFELIYKYFRIDLVGCLVLEALGDDPSTDDVMAIPRKDLQKKFFSGREWN